MAFTNMAEDERRQFKRVRLLQPIRGSVGRRVVYVLDGSPGGLGLLHRGALPGPGNVCRIVLHLNEGPLSADCEVVRTVPQSGDGRDEFFRSGVRIVNPDAHAREILQVVFAVRETPPTGAE